MPYKNKEDKTAYQREYMRRRRSVRPDIVRPIVLDPVEYETVVIGGTPFRRPT